MIKSGLVSITFRHLSPQRIVELVKQAGLTGVEWGGDVHCPHGDISTAKKVQQITTDAGLETSSYGSYYRVGVSENEGLEFQHVLDSAVALEAPVVRVWAGNKNAEDATSDYYKYIAEQTKRIADQAAEQNIRIAYEYHDGTLTNTADSTEKLLNMIDRDNVSTYWQPIHGAGYEKNSMDLKYLLKKVSNIHVFHWWPDHHNRHLLEDGFEHWKCYFDVLVNSRNSRWALMEFVKDDNVENFLRDAETLKKLLSQ